MPQVTCSKATAKVINVRSIKIAARLLGIERDIKIRTTRGYRRIGCHRLRDGQHYITFSTSQNPEDQSKTLWHELTHAAQVDQLGRDEYYKRYRMQQRSVGYKENALEKQANDCQDWNEALSLV